MNKQTRRSLMPTDIKISVEHYYEEIIDIKIDEWEWKSCHKINVKQNMGNERYIHENNQINYNAENN